MIDRPACAPADSVPPSPCSLQAPVLLPDFPNDKRPAPAHPRRLLVLRGGSTERGGAGDATGNLLAPAVLLRIPTRRLP